MTTNKSKETNNTNEESFLITRTIAMPENLNPGGGAFGGWIFSLMDIASIIAAKNVCSDNMVTRAVANLVFDKPMFLGDEISVFAKISKIGNTSINILIDVYVKRDEINQKTVSGLFTLVAVDEMYKPIQITKHNTVANSNIRTSL